MPPRSRVVPAISDVKRGTLREGATRTQSHLDRGAGVKVPMPHPPPVDPGGFRFLDKCRPGSVPAMSMSGVSQAQDRFRASAA